jgi:hypothetical protein
MAHLDPAKRQNGSLWRSNVSMISPAQAGRAYFLPGREKSNQGVSAERRQVKPVLLLQGANG